MTKFEQVEEVLGSAIVRGDVPGVVAMAATRDEVVYQAAFGRRALADEAAMSTDTVFWIASMTKAITSAAAMQLVEQGRLALDSPIASVLPELASPQVLEGFDAGDRWDYGINIDWVGKAVERVSGQALGEYFAEHLFGPIGMNDTGFKLTPERRARVVGMQARTEDGVLAPMEFELPQEPEFDMGGGGLYGTAADYL